MELKSKNPVPGTRDNCIRLPLDIIPRVAVVETRASRSRRIKYSIRISGSGVDVRRNFRLLVAYVTRTVLQRHMEITLSRTGPHRYVYY